jgi:PAS domain S-box-containing protein
MQLKEWERLQAVNRFVNLEFSKEEELQEIVELAAAICGTPTALITLIDENTQHIKFKKGFDRFTTTREESFCSYHLDQPEVMIVPDAQLDARFADNPLVTGSPNIRFYAGAPISTSDGQSLGSLCVIDQEPRTLTGMQQQMLEILSRQVIHLLEFEASLSILKEQVIQAKKSEIKLRSFFESSSACHLLLNKELEVMAFNKAASQFVKKNYDVTLAVGIKATDFIPTEHVPDFITNCNTALGGRDVELEKNFTYRSGENIWWTLTYSPARNPDGEIIGVSYNATDITRRIEQEQKVWAQNKSLRRIASIQSHEIRGPVASILGLVGLFERENFTATREELKLLKVAAEKLDERIRTIIGHTY